MTRVFSQTFQADRLEVPWNVRLQPCHRDRLAVEHLQDSVQGRFARKWRAPRQQFVEYGSERIDISGWADGRVRRCRLFRRHVTRRANEISRSCQTATIP